MREVTPEEADAWLKKVTRKKPAATEEDRLRKDAERYRWLRKAGAVIPSNAGFCWLYSDRLDKAVDAEISKRKSK